MADGRYVVAELEARIPANGERLVGGVSPTFSTTGMVFEPHGRLSGASRAARYRRMGGDVGPAGEPESFGAISDLIARVFPELASFARMHLCDSVSGEPMHAVANGWYWYAGSRDDLREAVLACDGYTGYDSIHTWRLQELGLPDTPEGRREYCLKIACGMLRVDEIPDMPGLVEIDDERSRESAQQASDLRARALEVSRGVDVRDLSAVSEARREANRLDREAHLLERATIERALQPAREAFLAFVDAQRDRWRQEAADARALLRTVGIPR